MNIWTRIVLLAFLFPTAGCLHRHHRVEHVSAIRHGHSKKVVHKHSHGCAHVLVGGQWVVRVKKR